MSSIARGRAVRLSDAEQARHGRDVVEDGAVREEAGVLDDVADAAAQLGDVDRGGVPAVDRDRARRRA